MSKRLPILTFHSIDNSGSVISVKPELFRRIITSLHTKGISAIGFSEICKCFLENRQLPEKSVVITFDDGFENVYSEVFPVLQEFDMKATLFLTTGYCGKNNDWPTQIPEVPILPLLNWQQVREMANNVFDIQPHTVTHPILTKLNKKSIQNELEGSKKEIEDRLGKAANIFCYPYGIYNDDVYDTVSNLFECACSTKLDYTSLSSDPFCLERIDMFYYSTESQARFFNTFLSTGYISFRATLREIRQKIILRKSPKLYL